MTLRRMLTAAGGLVIALAAVPRAPLHAQLEALRLDSRFILDAASSNLLEIRLGQAAQSKASNASVKQFGQQMVTDHTNLHNQLTASLSRGGSQFKPGMNDEDEDEVERLEKLSGSEFDREYMTAMIHHHQQDVATFQSQGSSARSAEARQLVSTALPVLQRHLTMATQVGAQVGATGGVAVSNPPTTPTQNPPVATQPGATTTQGTQADVNADMAFIRHAGSSNLMEVRLGQVAQSRASNAAVRQFGQRMVDDHTRMQNQLSAVVNNTGVSFTPAMDSRHQQQVSRIERLSGSEFDRAYMQAMIQGHQDDISQFQTQSQSARSTQIRNLASSSLPVLQQHLSLAVQVGNQVGADTTTDVATDPDRPNRGRWGSLAVDAPFIREVGQDNMMQVQMAELAKDRARDRRVRDFAEQIIRDHTRIQNQWDAMLERNDVSHRTTHLGTLHREKVDLLKDERGRNFDRAYMTTVIRQHDDELRYWRKEGRATRARQVRNLVNNGLPILEQHFAEAKRIGRQVGVNPEQVLRNRTDLARDRRNRERNQD